MHLFNLHTGTKLFKKTFLLLIISICSFTQCPAFIVVLDAGHGGKDPGALGTYSKEKNINLNVVLRLGKLIKENCHDVTIIYTRQTDKFVELYERANIANNSKADLFISVHTNSTTNNTTTGTETYSLTLDKAATNTEVVKRENSAIQYENNKQRYAATSLESAIMSEVIMGTNMRTSASFAKLIQEEYRKVGRPNRGVHQQNFHVLRQVAMPSVLTELGFISTPSEETYLNSEQGINELATAIFNAFKKHISPIMRGTNYDTTDNIINAIPNFEATSEEEITDEIKPEQRKNASVNRETKPTNTNKQETKKHIKSETTPVAKKEPTPVVKRESAPTVKKESQNKPKTTSAQNEKYEFKVQICTSDRQLRKDSEQFKGLKDVESYAVNTPNGKRQFVHTYGSSTSYSEIATVKNKLKPKFKDCFIVVFKNGQKVTGEEAANAFKKQP